MYGNPVGPMAATGLGAATAGGFGGAMWALLAAFAIIGAWFAFVRVMPTRARKFYRTAAANAAAADVPTRSWHTNL